ncbi:hypothetical protein BKA64DRAFT_648340 [Cadophora sp. MPI-SDFR-AT-0126]|nr:hypothetical protein BKA64DRAFT_648340 [Leotiomycetes sp. MPI-SDFR-AT-0126]
MACLSPTISTMGENQAMYTMLFKVTLNRGVWQNSNPSGAKQTNTDIKIHEKTLQATDDAIGEAYVDGDTESSQHPHRPRCIAPVASLVLRSTSPIRSLLIPRQPLTMLLQTHYFDQLECETEVGNPVCYQRVKKRLKCFPDETKAAIRRAAQPNKSKRLEEAKERTDDDFTESLKDAALACPTKTGRLPDEMLRSDFLALKELANRCHDLHAIRLRDNSRMHRLDCRAIRTTVALLVHLVGVSNPKPCDACSKGSGELVDCLAEAGLHRSLTFSGLLALRQPAERHSQTTRWLAASLSSGGATGRVDANAEG